MEVKFKLSKSQMIKLAHAHKNGTSITFRLNKSHICPNGIPLVLTPTEINKINSGRTHDITISASRVKKGGFLSALLAALPTIGTVLTGLSGLTGIAANIKQMVTGNGFISDLNIPLISPLAKMVGLGRKRKRKSRGKGLYLAP